MPPEQRWRKRNKSFVNLINRDLRFTSARAFSLWEPRRLAMSSSCQVKMPMGLRMETRFRPSFI